MTGVIFRNDISYGGGIELHDTQPISQIIESDAESIPGYIKILPERQSLLKSDYPELYDKIGDKYGNVDNNHFNIPSLVDIDEHYLDDDGYVEITSSLKFYNVESGFKVYAYRYGHMATLVFHGNYTGGQSTATKQLIEGLPAKYQPKNHPGTIDISFPLTAYNLSQYVAFGRAFFRANGRIDVGESNMTNPSSVRATVTYIV